VKSCHAMNLRDHWTVAREMQGELHRAQEAFPPIASPHEGYAVILEELDELWEAVKANRVETAIEEAVQVGAMAMRFVLDLRHRIGIGDEQEAKAL